MTSTISVTSIFDRLRNTEQVFAKFLVGTTLATAFLLLGHLKLPNDGGHALFLPFNILVWIAIFLIVAAGIWTESQSGVIRISGMTKGLFLASCFLTVPVFYPQANIGESLYRLIGVWGGLLLFSSLQQFSIDKRYVYYVLLLIVFATWIEAGRYWLYMFSEYTSAGAFPRESDSSLYGVFQQRNVMATFIGTGIVFSAYLLCEREQLTENKALLIFLILTPVFLAQILHTMSSRAGWYGTVLGIIFILPLFNHKAGFKLMTTWFCALLAGLSLSVLLTNTGDWVAPTKNIVSLNGLRTSIYPQSLAILADHWIGGIGYGRFEAGYIQFVAEKFSQGGLDTVAVPDTFHPHNEFLLWGVEGGILPVIGLLLASWTVLRRVLKLEAIYCMAVIGLFLPITFHSQVEYPFYHSALHWLIFILLILLVDVFQREEKTIRLPVLAANGLKATAVFLPIATSAFLLTTLYSGILLARFNSGLESMGVLQKINNPIVWHDKIDYAMTSTLLVNGVRTGNRELMVPYIEWANDVVTREPRPLFYEYLILAYQQSGQQEKARETLEEFNFLFPEREFREISIREL